MVFVRDRWSANGDTKMDASEIAARLVHDHEAFSVRGGVGD
jgi:hypothetical protein